MLPIRFCFNRFPRLVHDICRKLNKKVNLKLTGQDTELDKTVLERINDPLVHLVRNSLDHGLETPEQRRLANKPETGTLELKAYHESGNIVIEVIDDGEGLNTKKIKQRALEHELISEEEHLSDHQINNLIFSAGFSTAETVSDLSGRGVGLDVVKRNINDLGGDVWLDSEPGVGTKITIRLPLTLAILDGQLLRVGNEVYIIPLNTIIETLQVRSDRVNKLPGDAYVYRLRDQHIPIIRLDEIFHIEADAEELTDGLLIVVDSEYQQYGIWVDELLDQQQVVIKSLLSNFKHVSGIAGATILGDGTVALILDVIGIVATYIKDTNKASLAVA
jgi:two-component system chemotaxis sensor kinase CheA